MKNPCKHTKSQCLTPKGTFFPLASASWDWCPECGATRLISLAPNIKKYPWRSPKIALRID